MPSRADQPPALLLDTHVALWLMNGDALAKEPSRLIETAAEKSGVFVSPISAWEIATLTRNGRITLSLSPEHWFDAMLETGVQLAPMPPRTLIASAYLPGDPPADPADRILAATARSENFVLVTRDAGLLSYSKAGHLRTLRC